MNRTKVTVACKACQKKKVKCTGVSPCTNCIKASQRCEFTGTAKKRGPRNGNVEVIKSSARRIENVLQENPSLRDQIQQMLAHSNTRPTVRSARPPPVIPSDAPIVIIDDDTGVTTDASQSHGIPRRPSINPSCSSYSNSSIQDRHVPNASINLGAYPRDSILHKSEINDHRRQLISYPPLRRPIPMYPVNMPRNHVPTAQILESPGVPNLSNLSNLDSDFDSKTTLPSISELESLSNRNVNTPKFYSQNSSSNRMTLPVPNCTTRKKAISMPIVNSSSGIEVLLPPAPDLVNPFDSFTTSINHNQHPIELPPLDLPDKSYEPISTNSPFLSLPSPPSSQFFASPKTTSPGLYNMVLEKSQRNPPTPANSSPPLSPRGNVSNSDKTTNSLLSRPVAWNNNNDSGSFGTFSTFSRKGDRMEIDHVEIIF